jgi:hypothetical protein
MKFTDTKINSHWKRSQILTRLGILSILSFIFVLVMGLERHSSAGNTPYEFMVAGHVYGPMKPDGMAFIPNFSKFLKAYPLMDLDFIIFTGDFTHNGLPEEWDEMESEINDYPVRFHYVPGNHDLGNNDDFQRNTFLERTKREKVYDSFLNGEDLFIILDLASLENQMTEANGQEFAHFLKNALKKKHRHVFVFTHYIFWAKEFGIKSNTSIDPFIFWTDIFPLLKANQKEAFVFGGDTKGTFELVKKDNVTFIANGISRTNSSSVAVVVVGPHVRIIPTPILSSSFRGDSSVWRTLRTGSKSIWRTLRLWYKYFGETNN